MFSPASIASTVNEFVSILEPQVPAIAAAVGANPALVTQVTTGIDALKSGAASLAAADGTQAATPIAQRVVTDGEAVLTALSGLPLPADIAAVVRVAQMIFGILPFIVSLL